MIETVVVHNLEVLCKIGIWEWEQGQLQKVQLDLELGFDFSKVINSRRLEDTIDYGDLTRRVEALLQGKNFGYLEVVVEKAKAKGRINDPEVRQGLARAWSKVQIMRFNGLRTLTAIVQNKKDFGVTALGATNKMFWSEYHQAIMNLAIDILGSSALDLPQKLEAAVPAGTQVEVIGEARARSAGYQVVHGAVLLFGDILGLFEVRAFFPNPFAVKVFPRMAIRPAGCAPRCAASARSTRLACSARW